MILLLPCSDKETWMGVPFSLGLLVTKREYNFATVNGVRPKSCNSSTSTEVNERSPTPGVSLSPPQAASSSLAVPNDVSRAAFAAKQQSRIMSTRGFASRSIGYTN